LAVRWKSPVLLLRVASCLAPFRYVEAEGIGWIRRRREGISALTVMCTVNQFAGRPSYQQRPCRLPAGNFWMCDACDQLDEKIEHYKKVRSAMTDQLTIERITALIAELEAQKAALHPE
jgi:hypothetical protein